ncbi:MerR family transcriptional regulator [Actinophytocola oryzae]|uniref:DNA-binding transcriptional MerR regulator n=1 Tax=Actinophytocola oryzae TaxID=502181 RepID=A0A4R7VY97_9PSEU|nr:MerR family transcriptional regulator [Actinophytocola oryzae]TDV55146.1 DNA-binding transcriptional MerR regulator [Actinophytocola oryzae]
MNEYTVGAVATLAGVSVRTLHHYDEIGLLEPSERSASGYRLYSPADLRSLQRILFYRELDLDLGQIAEILDDPTVEHLSDQRGRLTERIDRYRAMVEVIDKELAARAIGLTLTPEERLEVFGSTRLEDNAERVVERWGDTARFHQRRDRVATYDRDDWLALRTEQADIHKRLAEAMSSGVPAHAPEVTAIAEEHRVHTHRWFHDCDHETHRELARAYRDNQRVGRNYDDMAPGLSQYIHDAIIANSDGHDRQRTEDTPAAPAAPPH